MKARGQYVMMDSKLGDFVLVSETQEKVNIGDYIEGRFLGTGDYRVYDWGTIYLFGFEILFSAVHNEDNTFMTWFSTGSKVIAPRMATFAHLEAVVSITPEFKTVKQWSWYWPVIKELKHAV